MGYHRRSLSETAMFRTKPLISPAFSFRRFASQVAEAYAGLAVLNCMNTLGSARQRLALPKVWLVSLLIADRII